MLCWHSGDGFWPLTLANNAVQKVTSCVVHATDKNAADALLTHTQPLNDCNRAFTTFQRQPQSFPQIFLGCFLRTPGANARVCRNFSAIKRLPQRLEFRIPYRVELGVLRFRIPNSVKQRTVNDGSIRIANDGSIRRTHRERRMHVVILDDSNTVVCTLLQ